MARRVATSAGIVLYRRTAAGIEILLGHMGGPYWAAKDDGAWSIPKGEYDESEDPYAAARREFEEEIGWPPPDGTALELGEITQRNGKVVTAFALEGDLDESQVSSNTFELEWPPRSGRRQSFPEIDRAAWFSATAAGAKALASQSELFDRLVARLDG
jgi:predicted NUDIX family NTP pyrophosphohydrolase